jgi:hypothetical protein
MTRDPLAKKNNTCGGLKADSVYEIHSPSSHLLFRCWSFGETLDPRLDQTPRLRSVSSRICSLSLAWAAPRTVGRDSLPVKTYRRAIVACAETLREKCAAHSYLISPKTFSWQLQGIKCLWIAWYTLIAWFHSLTEGGLVNHHLLQMANRKGSTP